MWLRITQPGWQRGDGEVSSYDTTQRRVRWSRAGGGGGISGVGAIGAPGARLELLLEAPLLLLDGLQRLLEPLSVRRLDGDVVANRLCGALLLGPRRHARARLGLGHVQLFPERAQTLAADIDDANDVPPGARPPWRRMFAPNESGPALSRRPFCQGR